MAQAEEIELKLACEPFDQAAILAAAPPGDDEIRPMTSVYFDTTDGDLAKAGVSLRVRHSKGVRVQTMKRGGGLAREEHEAEIAGDAPVATWKPLAKILPKSATLVPVFEVEVTRRQRLVSFGQAQIELALDVGEVRAGPRSTPVSELELELKAGEPAALFALALELSAAAPLYLSFTGKADRGLALLEAPSRKPRPALAGDDTAGAAFQAMARAALRQIALHAAQMREAPTPEAVHQVRVGARRLRSALITFAPLFDGEEAGAIKAELKWLAQAFDAARNLQVYADETIAPARGVDPDVRGLTGLAQTVEGARLDAQVRAAQAVSLDRFRRLMIEALAWVETGAWLSGDKTQKRATAFGAKQLDKRLRRLERAAAGLETQDDDQRHQGRIEAKKLRYAVEAFAGVFPAKEGRAFLRSVKALQDSLGRLNDLATAAPLVASLDLDADAAFAAGELAGAALAEKPQRIAEATEARERLSGLTPFWRA